MEIEIELLRKIIFVAFIIGLALFIRFDKKYHWLYKARYAAIYPRVWMKKIRDFNRKRVLNITLLVIFGLLIMRITIPLFTGAVVEATDQPAVAPDNLQTVLWEISPYILLTVAVTMPIFEEWIFRGIVLERAKYWGKIRGLFLSAGIFSVIHLSNLGYQLPFLIPPFIAGLVLGVIYLRQGLLAAVICHVVYNAIEMILAFIALGVI